MAGLKVWALAALLAIGSAAAQAGTTIVNLSADSVTPNAGRNSGTYAYNPVNLTLAAGVYTVRLAGIAGGGLYDAYSVYAPSPTNGAYTDSNFSLSLNNGASAIYTQGSLGRYNTAAQAFAAYSVPSPLYTFTLASTQTVSFYIDDGSSPYFGDNSGGVSLAVSAVPEPATLGVLGAGIAGLVVARRRRRRAAPVFA